MQFFEIISPLTPYLMIILSSEKVIMGLSAKVGGSHGLFMNIFKAIKDSGDNPDPSSRVLIENVCFAFYLRVILPLPDRAGVVWFLQNW